MDVYRWFLDNVVVNVWLVLVGVGLVLEFVRRR